MAESGVKWRGKVGHWGYPQNGAQSVVGLSANDRTLL
jgi:hypothetical protein